MPIDIFNYVSPVRFIDTDVVMRVQGVDAEFLSRAYQLGPCGLRCLDGPVLNTSLTKYVSAKDIFEIFVHGVDGSVKTYPRIHTIELTMMDFIYV